MGLDIVAEMNSYTEISPTGSGAWHLGYREKRHSRCRQNETGIEIYDRNRFFTVNSDLLPGTPRDVFPRQEQLDALCLRTFGPEKATRADAGARPMPSQPMPRPHPSSPLPSSLVGIEPPELTSDSRRPSQ